jgi:signal transduction histidine kinase/ActR/RegA family two-component response regulator
MTALDVRAEQIRTVYRQTGPVLLTNGVNSVIVSAALWSSVARPLLLGWLALIAVMSVARAWLYRRYIHATPVPSQAGQWGARFVVGSGAAGVLWGGACFFLMSEAGPLPELLVSFVIGGMCAAAAGTLASHLPAFMAFIGPALAALSLCMASLGGAMHSMMAVMVLIYAAGLIAVAKVNHRVLTEAFSLRFEKAMLLERLSAAQTHLEETNHTLEQRVVERTEAFRKQANALRDAQRMEAIGRLAGGVAHDFNNLLTVILINLSDLVERPTLDERTKGILREVRQAATRGADLVRQLLLFSRRQRAVVETLELNHVVRTMDVVLRRSLGEGNDLSLVLADTDLFVHLDAPQLEQILINLITNARDAMASGGVVTVETRTLQLSEAADGIDAGYYAVLSVGDTGVGMDAETRQRIFEPFFTTKEFGKGTGLGLATVYGIVEQSGGQIRVSSEPRQGSCFQVYFPLGQPSSEAGDAAAPRAGSGTRKAVKARGPVTVLLVEDEPSVRAVARRVLERAGHRVLAAQNADEALTVSAEHAGPIELLVTDVVMAGMDGPVLAARLCAQRPDLRALFISGYTRGHVVPRDDASSGVGFLGKPFTAEALLAKVNEVLAVTPQERRPASGQG